MTSPFPAELPVRPAAEAARVVALAHLDSAREALERLGDPSDAEALHDFRVSLRRLRTTLRAYRSHVGEAARKPMRRRLRDLATATSAGRDEQVLLQWLSGRERDLTPGQRTGLRWLIGRLETRRSGFDEMVATARAAFLKAERRLRRRLGSYQLTIDLESGARPSGPTFGAATAVAAGEQVDALAQQLAEVDASAYDALHNVRKTVKRLRYVLEPVAYDGVVVERLRELQDRLGELCDNRVAQRELADAVEAAAAERARALYDHALTDPAAVAPRRRDQRAGLVALARTARAQWDRGFDRFAAEWLEGRADPFLNDVRRLAEGLAEVSPSHRSGEAPDATASDPWTGAGRGGRRRRRRRRAPRSRSVE